MRDLQPTSYSMDKKNFPTEIRNETRMPSLTAAIQHSIGSPSRSNQTSKRNKGHPIGKEEMKLSLFADDMIVYMENPINSTKKLLNLVNLAKQWDTKSILRNQRYFLHQQ